MLHVLAKDIYSRLGTSVNTTGSVISGGTSGGGSGGTVAVTSLTQSQAVTAGSNTITLPSGGLSSTNYIVFALLVGGGGEGVMLLGQPSTQTATSFTFADLPIAGTLYYDAKMRS